MSDAVIYQRWHYPSRGAWLLWLAAMLFPAIYPVVFDGWRWEIMDDALIVWSVLSVLWWPLLKLRVTVTLTEVRLAFTLGWPRKRINRSDIRSVTPVRDWTRDAHAVRSNYYYMQDRGRQGVLLVLKGGKSLMVSADDPDFLVATLKRAGDDADGATNDGTHSDHDGQQRTRACQAGVP